MNEFRSKIVDSGAPTRASGEGARHPGTPPAIGSSVAASSRSLPPALGGQRPLRGDYAIAAVVVAALAVVAFVLGRMGASRLPVPPSAQQRVSQPAARPAAVAPVAPAQVEADALAAQPRAVVPFVRVEVEPADGEIWLDREVAGIGSVQLGAIDDGELHELRFVAKEHETTTLFFRGTPPTGRVILRRIPRQELAAAQTSPPAAGRDAPARLPAPQPHALPSVERDTRRADAELQPPNSAEGGPAVAVQPVARALPSADDAASETPAPEKPARIKLIEVHVPRVEVLD